MIKRLTPLLFIGFSFWGCEDKSELELIYSSISNGDIYDMNSGVLLKFSEQITSETFDAQSIESFGDEGVQVADTIDVDGSLQSLSLPDYLSVVNNSNFITLNNQPQTFFYNSKTNSCLLIGITTELYPSGTGEGFVPNQENNQLKIGDEQIDFTIEEDNLIRVVPNNYKRGLGFIEDESIRQIRFTNLSEYVIIDVYRADYENYAKRLIKNEPENGSLWWDLTDFNNEEVSSGFYIYRAGNDTLDNGLLNYSFSGYFSIAVPDE
ncbi:hypothetical protein OAN38_00320 [Candidatus Marinimicrobia bacterium]|nr:hypothetical protein [Candidatus Neomarinimicrobiota bacterium]